MYFVVFVYEFEWIPSLATVMFICGVHLSFGLLQEDLRSTRMFIKRVLHLSRIVAHHLHCLLRHLYLLQLFSLFGIFVGFDYDHPWILTSGCVCSHMQR